MKKNRKRLNSKGFTLVELLAVVVILALVMGIAASSMLNTMNSSRKSTLHSAAQTAATNLNNWVVEEQLVVSDDDKTVGADFTTYTQSTKKDQWICLSDEKFKGLPNKGNEQDLIFMLSLSDDDIVQTGAVPELNGSKYTVMTTGDDLTCSALRYNSSIGGYEFLLVAKNGGKYYVASDAGNNYAFSRAEGPNISIIEETE